MKKIKFYIGERQVYNLISKILKIGYFNSFDLTNDKFSKREVTFQGSILRPFFVNVFFDCLDKFVENHLFFRYNISREDNLNLEYLKTVDKCIDTESNEVFIFMKERILSFILKKIRKAFCKVKKNQTARNKIKYYTADYSFKSLWYVRYSTHMLLGLLGTKQDAVAIFKEIKIVLKKELSMEIQLKKAGVNHYSNGVLFLGYWLFGKYDPKLNLGVQNQYSNRIRFSVPIRILIKSYATKGFLQIAKKGKNIKYVGRRVDKWIFLSRDEKVIKRFNSIMKSIANYYSGTSYPSALYELWELFRRSAALTLAHRRKMRTVKSAFQK